MAIETPLKILETEGLHRFQELRSEAVAIVSERFYFSTSNKAIYDKFGPRGREACREDIGSHLDFLRPVLEFGLLRPMIAYLVWVRDVLAAREIPAEHVAQALEWLADFFAWRMGGEDGTIVAGALKAARTEFLVVREAHLPREAPEAPTPSAEPWPEQSAFETALLAGQRTKAHALAKSCLDDGRSLVDLEQGLIRPSLYQIGQKWQTNQVTVAQEHMATAIAQSVMTMGLLHSTPARSIGKTVLLACVEGNHHHVGLQMVSDAFQLDGWDVQYLGSNMPTTSLVAQAVAGKPDLVCLSASFPHQLRVVKKVIALLNEQLGDARPPVVLGGLAINQFTELADAIGADAYCTTPAAAVAYARQSAGSRRAAQISG